MHIVVFSAKPYDRQFLEAANVSGGGRHRLTYFDVRLSLETATLVKGADAVCAFVNDTCDAATLGTFADLGIRILALRSAGFNNVDLVAARRLGITVARVPAYSPESVAEHTVAMMLALNRHIHRAYNRVREGNFALDGLLGFNMHGRSVGIMGTGRIGLAVARIVQGFGCKVLAHDPFPAEEGRALGIKYVSVEDLLAGSDIVTLHCPLTPETRHLIDDAAVSRMRHGAMLINTSRGAIVDTRAAIAGLKSGAIGLLGLDVYEEEADLFFEDLSGQMLHDDIFARLLTFPNVLITAHQAFFTTEALTSIAETTIGNVTAFAETGHAVHEISTEKLA